MGMLVDGRYLDGVRSKLNHLVDVFAGQRAGRRKGWRRPEGSSLSSPKPVQQSRYVEVVELQTRYIVCRRCHSAEVLDDVERNSIATAVHDENVRTTVLVAEGAEGCGSRLYVVQIIIVDL